MTPRDIALTVLIILSWALNITMIRIGALEVPPLFLLSIRFALGALIFLPFVKRIPFSMIKNICIYALFYIVAHLGLLYAALEHVESSIAGLILESGAAFLVLLGWIFYGEKFGLRTAGGLFFAFLGVGIILYEPGESGTFFGMAMLTLSALVWAIGAMRMRNVSGIDLPTMTVISYGFALPIIAILSFFLEDNQFEILASSNHVTIGIVLFYQVVFMSIALYGWQILMSRNEAYKLAAIGVLQPLFVVLFGFVLLGETLSLNALIGGAIAFSGVAFITLRQVQKRGLED